MVGWGLTALLKQIRSYHACKFIDIINDDDDDDDDDHNNNNNNNNKWLK